MDLSQLFSVSEETGLIGLFAAAFAAATIIPLSSEVILLGFLQLHPHAIAAAVTVATLGNTLGGMTSYAIGRFVPQPKSLAQIERVRRFGAPILMLAWLPVIGDALCLAAGWLRIHWFAAAAFQAIGRVVRYVAVVWLVMPQG